MTGKMSRRELLHLLGMGGAAVSLGLVPGRVAAQAASEHTMGALRRYQALTPAPAHAPVTLEGGRVIQPARELPAMHSTDVLVVGGGPAGVMAALAARRAGAKVALIERYGCFGGLWTGGLVLVLIGTHVKEGGALKKVVRGIPDECFERLKKMGMMINQEAGKYNPTPDPEAAKVVLDAMLQEAGVDLFLHCWGADAIMEGKTVKGAVFESKEGRQAILAKVVIDATGDGDIFASAGAGFEQIAYHVGTNYRLGNTDRVDAEKGKKELKLHLGSPEPNPATRWVNMAGEDANCLKVADLTRLELAHRRTIWAEVEKIRQTPGYEKVFLLQTASQLGVRISRLLAGTAKVTHQDYLSSKATAQTVSVCGSFSGLSGRALPVPYGALVPKEIDGLLAAGRCICMEPKVCEVVRLIPACMTIGQAAGAAAALAVAGKAQPREVEPARLRELLTQQGAYVG